MPAPEDIYYKKTLTFRAWKRELRFRVSQDLFSSFDIDKGTRLLLRTIVEAGYPDFSRILDIGCGYGPLGLMLKSLYPAADVHMVDRDALAVDYTRQNAALNDMTDIEVYPGLGYDDVTGRDFDLIVSNIPGKAGTPVITSLLRETGSCLAPGGMAAVVVVSPLGELVRGILEETQGVEITLHRKSAGHAVFHYGFSEPAPETPLISAFDRGVYQRGEVTLNPEGQPYTLKTARGLPEFDSLGYSTMMLLRALHSVQPLKLNNAVVFNPGQGHATVFLWKLAKPEGILLADRDLLALRYSRMNLVKNGCPAEQIKVYHQTGLKLPDEVGADLIAGIVREDEGQAAARAMLEEAAARLSTGGVIVLAGSSTAVTRLVTRVEAINGLAVGQRERFKGYSSLVLEQT